MMKRTQIQLEENVWEEVRRLAFEQRLSVAAAIRQLIEKQLFPVRRRRRTAPVFSFIGSGKSRGKGSGRISERHDEEIAKAFSS